ncbi:MAG: type II CAAX endopeptidase family protein [Myxococcota bacterium]
MPPSPTVASAHETPTLVLLLVATLSVAPLVPPAFAAAPAVVAAGLLAAAVRAGHGPAIDLGLAVTATLSLLAIPNAWLTWPAPLLAGLAVYAALVRRGWWRGAAAKSVAWWRRGTIDRGSVGLAIAFAVVASVALVLWWTLAAPDLRDLSDRLPAAHPAWLVLGGLTFSMANALAEEAMWRGVITHALAQTIGRAWVVLIVQAASFGLVHVHGFPRGVLGVALAAVYGLMMGELRRRTGGLLLPWLAHIVADVTIVSVVAALALG